jgi:hypothetical protein
VRRLFGGGVSTRECFVIDAQPEVINLIGESREGIPLEFPWNVWGDVGIVPPPCPGWNGYVAG